MKFKQLAKLICEKEGKKSKVNIAQVSEILAILGDMCPDAVLDALWGWKPVKQKKKKAKKK